MPQTMIAKSIPPASLGVAPSAEEVVAWLRSPAAYPERPTTIECLETHISWVFLGDRQVYKLKKPVRFDFLDFSTPELRRAACEAELRLNARLAKGVYLAVVPITRASGGKLALGGKGPAVEWLVKMRRLPAERMLDQRIKTGRLTSAEIEALAAYLARFYQQASPLTLGAGDYRRAIGRHLRGNRRELLEPAHELAEDLVKRIHAAQFRFIELEAAQIEGRVCDGRIVDGHGDLRPEHVCLEHQPAIFDCVEFNDELRRIDVADELGFLAMECDRHGAEAVGNRVLEVYCRQNHDRVSDMLTSFYKSYRACVRAKVAALAAQQAAGMSRRTTLERAGDYLRLAGVYASRLGPAAAIVVSGLAGSGKSTLAVKLADCLGCELVQTDQVRRELFGASPSPAGFKQGIYRPELQDRVYDELLRRAERLLANGVSVVVDGTFLAARHRQRAGALARGTGAVPLVVRCACPEQVALERLARRAGEGGSLSEARPELLRLQQAEYEADPDDSTAIEIDTTEALGVQQASVLEALRQALAAWVAL